jgi:hypothetical protein
LPVYFSLSDSVVPFYSFTSRFRIPLGCFTCLPLGLFSLFRRPPEFIGYVLLREHIFPVFIKEKSGRE